MTWTVIAIIVLGIAIKMFTSPPSAVVGWIVSKYALHPKLDSKDVTITFNDKNIEGKEKLRFTDYFNEAQFLERYNVFQGNEKLFLHPETNDIPFVINVKRRKKDVNFYVYINDDRLIVVKQWKKKVACYSISSDYLQEFSTSNSMNV